MKTSSFTFIICLSRQLLLLNKVTLGKFDCSVVMQSLMIYCHKNRWLVISGRAYCDVIDTIVTTVGPALSVLLWSF